MTHAEENRKSLLYFKRSDDQDRSTRQKFHLSPKLFGPRWKWSPKETCGGKVFGFGLSWGFHNIYQ